MKKKLLAVAVPAAMVWSVGAHAQSSVTLYGIVDAGLVYAHNAQDASGANQSTLVKFNSGGLSGDRWGLRGREDLGSGLAAIFQLENGFNIGTGALGQGSREFGRKAVVGLTSTQWGTVTLGRQYDPNVDLVQPLTEDGYFGGIFATPGDLDNYDNSARISNSIKYVSPVLSGLQFEALYAFGNTAGTVGAGQTFSGGLAYNQGPLALAASYFHADGGRTTANNVRTWTSSTDSLFNTVINAGFASAKSVQIVRAGGLYALGALSFGASYSNTQYKRDGFSSFGSDAKFNSGAGFVNYRFSTALQTGIGYSYTSLTGPTSAHYHQISLGGDYLLSKRTDLYLVGGYQKASGQTLSAGGAVIGAEASVGSYGVNSGASSQAIVSAGLRHRF
ncbi:porin [Robbsia sp. KACC 23696]|uniref:porin n=1 Tax=Robbsia sp. KACC 23696 TaxID=3149231 RepID=UPI00325ABA03